MYENIEVAKVRRCFDVFHFGILVHVMHCNDNVDELRIDHLQKNERDLSSELH